MLGRAPSRPFPTGRAAPIVSAFHLSRCAGAVNQKSSWGAAATLLPATKSRSSLAAFSIVHKNDARTAIVAC